MNFLLKTIGKGATVAKHLARRIKNSAQKSQMSEVETEKLHSYWKAPWDGKNSPETYLDGKEKTDFLFNAVSSKISVELQPRILDIGCNSGRNLYRFYEAGFRNLFGIDISRNAIDLLKKQYSQMLVTGTFMDGPAEDLLKGFPDNHFDFIFTMAVLGHIQDESVFREIVRIMRRDLFIIENESAVSWRHLPRSYEKVFGDLGLEQVGFIASIPGMAETYRARHFRKLRKT